MKMIILVVGFCCVALLPSTSQNYNAERIERLKQETDQLRVKLNAIARENKPESLVNGIFRLTYNGFLGIGGFALVYKGTFEGNMPHNGIEVAMKFTPMEMEKEAEKEYEMYTYLKAIDNPNAESNGIPMIYYYGQCDKYMLMAMTLLEPKFNENYENSELQYNDILIIFREFTKITKYMHRCGVKHNDIKPENLMFRRNRLFIIDYNVASKMKEPSNGGTPKYCALALHIPTKIRCAKDDWESFLYSMCKIVNYDLPWFPYGDLKNVRRYKGDKFGILRIISEMQSPEYREIFSLFANHVLKIKSEFPDYDEFYGYFDRMIPKPNLVSWLPQENQELYERNIDDIPNPSEVSFYGPVNVTYFTDIYRAHGGHNKFIQLN